MQLNTTSYRYFILTGSAISIWQLAIEKPNVYISIMGIAILMIGLLHVMKAIPNHPLNQNPNQHDEEE